MPIEMKLARFRVTTFRSVEDSGWIDVDDVTALIGTNESGKSNLLLPLWKLNPAKDGEIHPTSDFPRKHFTALRRADTKPVFIEADIEVHGALRTRIARKAGLGEDVVKTVTVRRRLDGSHEIDFPLVPQARTVPVEGIASLLASARTDIASMEPMKTEQELTASILQAIAIAQGVLPATGDCDLGCVSQVSTTVSSPNLEGAPKTSSIVPRFERLREQIDEHKANLSNSPW